MKKTKLIGHTAFLILFNWIVFITLKTDTMHFKGLIAIGGVGKQVVTSGILMLIMYLYINQYYVNKYKMYFKEKTIAFLYLNSPLFAVWIIMNFYLFSISKLMSYFENFNYFILVYVVLCLFLMYFQNRIFAVLENIKAE